jgi:plastocyanin
VRTAGGLVVLALAAPAFAGSVQGKVELLEKGGRKATDLSDVVVYVEGAKARPKAAVATMTMKGKAFIPRVVAVPVDGTVEFPNEDPIFHNVFSVSGDNRFDLDLYKRPKSGARSFQHPGLVRVYCNIHPQMSAFILVRDNPFWTRPDRNGAFVIADVPAGTWVVKAWHERSGETAETAIVPEDGEVDLPVTLDASRFKQAPHKNKYGKDYQVGEKY